MTVARKTTVDTVVGKTVFDGVWFGAGYTYLGPGRIQINESRLHVPPASAELIYASYGKFGNNLSSIHQYFLDIGDATGVTFWTNDAVYELEFAWQMWDSRFPCERDIANFIGLRLKKRDTIEIHGN